MAPSAPSATACSTTGTGRCAGSWRTPAPGCRGARCCSPPAQVAAAAGDPPALRLALTREEVRASPPLEARRAGLAALRGGAQPPLRLARLLDRGRPAVAADAAGGGRGRGPRRTSHLRSTDEMTGYHIGASDGAHRPHRGLPARPRRLGDPLPRGRHRRLVGGQAGAARPVRHHRRQLGRPHRRRRR